MTSLELYWLLKLDDIHSVLSFVFFICSVLLFGTLVMYVFMVLVGDEAAEWAKPNKVLLLVGLLAGLLKSFLPTTTQMAVIMVVPPIVNNAKVQQLPDKVLDLVNQKLDELKSKQK